MSGRHMGPPPMPGRLPSTATLPTQPSTVGGSVEYFCLMCGTYAILSAPLTSPRKMVHKHEWKRRRYVCESWTIVEELQFGEVK